MSTHLKWETNNRRKRRGKENVVTQGTVGVIIWSWAAFMGGRQAKLLWNGFKSKSQRQVEEEGETNFDGSNAKPAGLKKQTDAACGNSFPETAYDSTSYQHVLHFVLFSWNKLFQYGFFLAWRLHPCFIHWKNENRTFRGKKMQLQAFASKIRHEPGCYNRTKEIAISLKLSNDSFMVCWFGGGWDILRRRKGGDTFFFLLVFDFGPSSSVLKIICSSR